MAVYTRLEESFVRAMLALYDEPGELVHLEGIAAGSINTTYRVDTDAGVFFLRVNEGKAFDDLLCERDLLDELDRRRASLGGVITPRLLRTRVGSSFFAVPADDGQARFAGLFPKLEGRDLGVFEVTAGHVRQVGAFLARAHEALRGWPVRRKNPYGLPVVERWLWDIGAHPPLVPLAQRLRQLLVRISRARRLLPRGAIHGDLFVDNTKWKGDELVAVFDWEMAGSDHLALDVAVCLHAWCWRRQAGRFDDELCRALLAGYESVRRLHASERRGLYVEALLAAVRFTASRARDFELPARSGAERLYLDYRDFEARLDTLLAMGRRNFRRMLGLP